MRREEDAYVVPYNPHLLMMFDGSVQTSQVGSGDLADYMTKYMTKTDSMLDFIVKNPEGKDFHTEIGQPATES
jgi:hypothetical protein